MKGQLRIEPHRRRKEEGKKGMFIDYIYLIVAPLLILNQFLKSGDEICVRFGLAKFLGLSRLGVEFLHQVPILPLFSHIVWPGGFSHFHGSFG